MECADRAPATARPSPSRLRRGTRRFGFLVSDLEEARPGRPGSWPGACEQTVTVAWTGKPKRGRRCALPPHSKTSTKVWRSRACLELEKAVRERLGIWSAPTERQRRPALRLARSGAARGALAFWSVTLRNPGPGGQGGQGVGPGAHERTVTDACSGQPKRGRRCALPPRSKAEIGRAHV